VVGIFVVGIAPLISLKRWTWAAGVVFGFIVGGLVAVLLGVLHADLLIDGFAFAAGIGALLLIFVGMS
jgi:predicted membrane-bound spermidine synthase